jgi:hypothetical protein
MLSPDRPRHTENLGREMHRHAFVAKYFQNLGGNVGIFAAGKLRSGLDDRHLAAEAAIGLRQLQADIAAAEDDQMAGQSVELERLDIGERCRTGEAWDVGDRRVRPEIEHHAVAGQQPPAAVVQAHFDGLRPDEPARAHDQFGAARPVTVEMHLDQAVDHLAFVRQHSPHVDGGSARHAPEAIRVVDQVGDLRTPNLVLAGQAVGIRTGTADQLALDDGCAVPRLGHVPSQKFSGLAAAEDEQVIVSGLRHRQLPPRNMAPLFA